MGLAPTGLAADGESEGINWFFHSSELRKIEAGDSGDPNVDDEDPKDEPDDAAGDVRSAAAEAALTADKRKRGAGLPGSLALSDGVGEAPFCGDATC